MAAKRKPAKKKKNTGQGTLGTGISRALWVGPDGRWAVFGPYGNESGTEDDRNTAKARAQEAFDRVCRKPATP